VIEKKFANQLRIRVCAIIVSDNSLLLLKHNSPTRKENIWLPPGGGVNFGETLESALTREAQEETGLIIQPTRLVWVHEYLEDPYHAIEFYFDCSISGGMLKLGKDPELAEKDQMLIDLKFVTPDEAGDMEIYPEFLKEFVSDGCELPGHIQHVSGTN
jgi:8-oxo-dGTP diphosphatase